MKFIPFNATPEQRDNLATLKDVLASPERRRALATDTGFDMSEFRGARRAAADECGTVACAVGWGPIAGIGMTPEEQDYYGTDAHDWLAYMNRAFGLGTHLSPVDVADQAADFLMRAFWHDIDNTPEGAARRIGILLRRGIPIIEKEFWELTAYEIQKRYAEWEA